MAREIEAQLARWLADGPITASLAPALDVEPALDALDLGAFRELARRRVKRLSAAMRALNEQVAAPGTFFAAGTRMGGHHGLRRRRCHGATRAAASGFRQGLQARTARRRGQGGRLHASATADEIAEPLIEETID